MTRFSRDETLRNRVYVTLICVLALVALSACAASETPEEYAKRRCLEMGFKPGVMYVGQDEYAGCVEYLAKAKRDSHRLKAPPYAGDRPPLTPFYCTTGPFGGTVCR